MTGLYLEEFVVGHVFQHSLRKTVTESDNMLFSVMTLNPQPLHIDFDFAAKSEWGKPLVNSLFIGLDDRHLGQRHNSRHDRRQSRHEETVSAPGLPRRTIRVETTVISVRTRNRSRTAASSSSSTAPTTRMTCSLPNAQGRR
jgi:hypothetical protein